MSETVPMAPAPSKVSALVKYMQSKQGAFAAVASKHLTAERMVRIVGALLSRQPKLADCTPISVLTSVMAATQLGLDPTGIGGQGYLVPFNRSEKRGDKWIKILEAQFIPGYRGLMEIAYRTGTVETIQPYAVFEGDRFRVMLGSNPTIEHEPTGSLRVIEKLTHVYCVATFKTGRTAFRVLTRAELDGIKARAVAKMPEWQREKSAWATDEIAMMLKSGVRRMCNWLPQTPDLSLGVALSDGEESGDGVDTAMIAAQLGADLKDLGGREAMEEGAVEDDRNDDATGQQEAAPKSRTESTVRRVRETKAAREVVATQAPAASGPAPEPEVPDEAPTTESKPESGNKVAEKLLAAKTLTERLGVAAERFMQVRKFDNAEAAKEAVLDYLGDHKIETRDMRDDAKWARFAEKIAAPDWRL